MANLTVSTKPPMVLPPLDVQWVWYCHTLNPVSVRNSKVIPFFWGS